MRAHTVFVATTLLLTSMLMAGLARAELPHHRLVQTLYPLEEEFSNGAAGPPDSIWFGAAVAMRNGVALVGMPRQRDGGRVAVFTRSTAGVWQRTATLQVPNDSQFGQAIAYRDGTAIVASITSVYVFKLSNGSWRRTDRLVPPAADDADQFGRSLVYQDGMAVVGAPRRDGSGLVYVFQLSSAGKRMSVQRLQASDGQPGDSFGHDVSMTFDTIVVGAPQQTHPAGGEAAGAAYVFRRSSSTWRQTQKLVSTELDPEDRFGAAVAIDRGMILVGAPGADRFDGRFVPPYTEVILGGAVYGFVPSGGLYAEALKLRPTATDFEQFGNEIVMFDRFIAVAAEEPHDPSGATIATSSAWTYNRSGNVLTPRARTNSGYIGNSLAIANNWLLSGSSIDDFRCFLPCIGFAKIIDMNYLE